MRGNVLEAHGTKAFIIKPSSVVTAAEADLALRRRQSGKAGGQGYCFHRRHVARASCALDLIDRAIKDRYSGVYGGKRITRIIYGDEELLWAARALASPLQAAS